MKRMALLCAAALLSAGTLSAQQRTFVSAQTGSDTNPCSITSPCRSFDRALSVVTPGGEVVALDSGGYGAMTIDKSVSVVAPAGVHAGITAAKGVTIGGGYTTVTLRGLYMTGVPAGGSSSIGVSVESYNSKVAVENCTIIGFATGVRFFSTGLLAVRDSAIRHASLAAISTGGLTEYEPAATTVDNVRVDDAGHSVVEPAAGIAVWGFGHTAVRNSTVTGAFRGFVALGRTEANVPANAAMFITDSLSFRNYVGVLAAGHPTDQSGQAVIQLANVSVTGNGYKGIERHPNSLVNTFGNNQISANGANDPLTPIARQ